jgi:SAM-dependent methyltransferase
MPRAGARGAALAHGRAEHLPWGDQTFERVFCITAFHHFEDKVGFLAEARRVLVPGGQVMTVGLDPHTGVDRWYIYEYFEPVLAIDKRRYPASNQIREWMHALQFSHVCTSEVQQLRVRLPAREALEEGRLDKGVTSQLAVLTDEEYQRAVQRIRRAIESADALGDTLYLAADLRLYATLVRCLASGTRFRGGFFAVAYPSVDRGKRRDAGDPPPSTQRIGSEPRASA